MRRNHLALLATCLVLALLSPLTSAVGAPGEIQSGEMAGYLIIPHGNVPETYNGGFTMYIAAWPLLQEYPGRRFQTGLPGTWMHAQYDGPTPYSDIEGGLGWWRGTRFATETPKFHAGGVTADFSEWSNAPGAGKGTDWNNPKGQYGLAQLSPWLLFPPDGLALKEGTCGELFGYGWIALPLTTPKAITDGKNIPTGNNCWTLFVTTQNFKGPAAFFTPYFWSHGALTEPNQAGKFLDCHGGKPNRPVQMETQYVPSVQATDVKGETYARVAPTRFPRGPQGDSVILHRAACYTKKALWETVEAWFEGGPAASGVLDPKETSLYTFSGQGRATWSISTPGTPKGKKPPIAWSSFATPVSPDPNSYGYRWDNQVVTKQDTPNGSLAMLPEYYHLVDGKWVPVAAKDVPPETGLAQVSFHRPQEQPSEPFIMPDDPDSCWKKPGPAAGPFQAHPGDGSVVTYYWYRFADQPALLNAGLTKQEREEMQRRVEMIHRNWTKDRNYVALPTVGKLAEIDPALLVTPPAGLEVGYVPIATRQEKK